MPGGFLFNLTNTPVHEILNLKPLQSQTMTAFSSSFQKTNQDKYSSDAFLSSFPQISMTPPALDAILSAESDSHFVTDLFTCVIVSLLLCDVICVALCSPNFQAVSVRDTTANTGESPVH